MDNYLWEVFIDNQRGTVYVVTEQKNISMVIQIIWNSEGANPESIKYIRPVIVKG